jgi:hypothetical protein
MKANDSSNKKVLLLVEKNLFLLKLFAQGNNNFWKILFMVIRKAHLLPAVHIVIIYQK